MKMSTNLNKRTGRSTNFLLTMALFAFTVFSGFNAGAANLEKSSTIAPMTGCTVPMTLTASTITATTVTVTWPTIASAGWFVFQYRIVGSPTWTSAGSSGGVSTSKTFSGLVANTDYEIRGRIYCSGSPSSSAWSTPTTFSTLVPAGCELPPVISASAITGTTFTLDWAAVTGAGWYGFRYRVTGTGTWTAGGSAGGAATSKDFIGFTPNTSYDVEAQTFCPTGTASAYSSIVVVTPDVPTASVISGDAIICVGSATPISIMITGGTSPFEVEYKVNAAYTTVSGYVSGTNIMVSPAVSGVYEIVSVTDANGYVGVGNTGTATVTVNTPALAMTPGTYTSTQMIADGASVDFASGCDEMGTIADAAGGNVIGLFEMEYSVVPSVIPAPGGYIWGRRIYEITMASPGEFTLTARFTQADFDDYNLNATGMLQLPTTGDNADPNKNHFRLAMFDEANPTTSVLSAPLGSDLNWDGTHWVLTTTITNSAVDVFGFTTQPNCVGITVSGLAVTSNTASSVSVSWTSVVTTPAGGDYSFQYRDATTGPTGLWTSGGSANNAATTKTIAGLTPGINYELQIRRNCSFQSSGAWSASVMFTTPSTGCGAPMAITSPVTAVANSATIDWVAVTGAAWFQLQYKESASGTWISAGTSAGGTTSKVITGLMASTSYDVQGRTFCPNGSGSAWSASETFTTPAASGCALAPTLTIATTTASSVSADWVAVTGAGWYTFRYKETASGTWISGGSASGAAISKTWVGLSAGVMYDLQARTYCPTGIPSDWSATVNFTTTPPSMTVENNGKDVTIDVADKGLSTAVVGVYPNPVVDFVNVSVEFETANETATIKLMDMNGRLVRELNTTSVEGVNTFKMNLSELNSGMYMMFVYSNENLLMTSKVKKN